MKKRIYCTRLLSALSGVFISAAFFLFLIGINHPIHRLFRPTVYPNVGAAACFLLLGAVAMLGTRFFESKAVKYHKALKAELRELRKRLASPA